MLVEDGCFCYKTGFDELDFGRRLWYQHLRGMTRRFMS